MYSGATWPLWHSHLHLPPIFYTLWLMSFSFTLNLYSWSQRLEALAVSYPFVYTSLYPSFGLPFHSLNTLSVAFDSRFIFSFEFFLNYYRKRVGIEGYSKQVNRRSTAHRNHSHLCAYYSSNSRYLLLCVQKRIFLWT